MRCCASNSLSIGERQRACRLARDSASIFALIILTRQHPLPFKTSYNNVHLWCPVILQRLPSLWLRIIISLAVYCRQSSAAISLPGRPLKPPFPQALCPSFPRSFPIWGQEQRRWTTSPHPTSTSLPHPTAPVSPWSRAPCSSIRSGISDAGCARRFACP